jgi:hypothetical protein
MKTLNKPQYITFLTVIFSVLFSTTAVALDKNEKSGQKAPVKLVYTYSESKVVSYISATAVTQTMDINGQTMNTLIQNNLSFKVKSLGSEADNLKLQIGIDSLSTIVESPNGSTGGKINDVKGKTFSMILSPRGKEIDVKEAAKIEYTVEGVPTSNNLEQYFKNIFPDLPEKAVTPGETWTKNDTITSVSTSSSTTQIINGINKFEGIEKINGFECAKITSTFTGTMKTTAQNMGMDIFYSGPIQGTVTLFFAIKEGYFIRQEVSSKMEGTIEITGTQNMTFPLRMDTKNKIEALN